MPKQIEFNRIIKHSFFAIMNPQSYIEIVKQISQHSNKILYCLLTFYTIYDANVKFIKLNCMLEYHSKTFSYFIFVTLFDFQMNH